MLRQACRFLCLILLGCGPFAFSLHADDLLKSDWQRSKLAGVKQVFEISGTGSRNNPIRKQFQQSFESEELFVRFRLTYDANSIDTAKEGNGEFFVFWLDAEQGGDTATHQGVPNIGIHVDPKSGENRFMVRFASQKEVFSGVELKGDREYEIVARVSRTQDAFNKIDLWVDPDFLDRNKIDATTSVQKTSLSKISWLGFSTGGKTEPSDSIRVTEPEVSTSWDSLFGLPPAFPKEKMASESEKKKQVTHTVSFDRDVLPILKTRCFDCHSGNDPDSGVRLDVFDETLNFLTPHHSNKSRLIDLITSDDAEERMPPVDAGKALPTQEVQILKTWIDEGVAWNLAKLPTPKPQTDHWAFRPPVRPDVPEISRADWVRTPVDAFIGREHERLGLTPAETADKETLLRRVSLDLLGLPPDEKLIPSLKPLREKLELAYKTEQGKLIDEWIDNLLTTTQYGERWGRHWLDLARWAESNGHQHNRPRPHAWRYRDYVVESFRSNKPFNEFVREQLAGDQLLFTPERTIATGFLAAARYSGNELDKEIQRNDILVDVVNTTASTFLGLTMECAQCHTHKFDPLTIRDYYRLQAFFTKGQPANVVLQEPEHESQQLIDYRWRVFDSVHHRLVESRRERNYPEPILVIPKSVFSSMKGRERELFTELESRIGELPQTWGWKSADSHQTVGLTAPHTMRWPLERDVDELQTRKTFLRIRGDVKSPGPEVNAGWPSVFGDNNSEKTLTRLDLADWLCADDHPLTARVWVNRIWQWHFGTGLVTTSSDFGTQGAKPTHPELLDWLAGELIDSDWNTNHIHQLILRSNTYRLASRDDSANRSLDQANQFRWRWTPRRLEAEAIRDLILAMTGKLDTKEGGPSVPLGETDSSTRRSLYLAQQRDRLSDQQRLFDSPEAVRSCSRRAVSTVPLQSLYLLNSKFLQQSAAHFAERVQSETNEEKQIAQAIRLALGREAEPDEISRAKSFLTQGSFEELCLVLLNLNEFVYLP